LASEFSTEADAERISRGLWAHAHQVPSRKTPHCLLSSPNIGFKQLSQVTVQHFWTVDEYSKERQHAMRSGMQSLSLEEGQV
jgi:hypothetical protein